MLSSLLLLSLPLPLLLQSLLLLLLPDIPWIAALTGSRPSTHPSQRSRQRESSPFISTSQATQKDEAPKKKERTSSAASSRNQWKRAWNRHPTQRGDADFSEASPASPASTASRPAANENSSRVNLPDQADHGRLYKWAPPSRVKESTERSRRDYFSGSSPSFSSKRPHWD